MTLKRKRSCSAMSLSTTSTATISNPASPSSCESTLFPASPDTAVLVAGNSIMHDAWTMRASLETPLWLNSRTRKRYRSNRPEEEIVHGRFPSSSAIYRSSSSCRKYYAKALRRSKIQLSSIFFIIILPALGYAHVGVPSYSTCTSFTA